MVCITLTTDFGLSDGYAGVLRGVIWTIAPEAQIADLTHEIDPQNILQGALLISRHAGYFPEGTIHLGVVDPGVGTSRRGLAAHIGKQLFCGPDNGLASLLLESAQKSGESVEMVCLDQPEFWLPSVSSVFHGRDIFAPVAAHLANGIPLARLGSPVSDPVLISLTEPHREKERTTGEVLYTDRFGNATTNLRMEDLDRSSLPRLYIKDFEISHMVHAYGEADSGKMVFLIGSAGLVEIAVVNGNAANQLNIQPGDPVMMVPGNLRSS